MGNNIKKASSGRGGGQGASDIARNERKIDKKEVVLKRLRKQQQKLGLRAEELEEMALDLSDKDRMKKKYFSELLEYLDNAVDAVQEEKKTCTEIRNTREQNTRMQDIAREAYRIQTVEVKLALCTLRTRNVQKLAEKVNKYIKRFEYGAFHAAININGIVLEWNSSNLVIPCPQSQSQWIFERTVHNQEEGGIKGVVGESVPVRAGKDATREHFEHIIERLDEIRMEKEALIDALVEVAVRYNTKYEYGILSSNCQHFVCDCLHVIGYPEDKLPFGGQIKTLVDHLMKAGATTTEDFATHEDLDQYIDTLGIFEMTVEDMEYYICLYHLFHAMEDIPEDHMQSCKIGTLQERVKEKKTTLTTS